MPSVLIMVLPLLSPLGSSLQSTHPLLSRLSFFLWWLELSTFLRGIRWGGLAEVGMPLLEEVEMGFGLSQSIPLSSLSLQFKM